ncbi:MAG: YigZ family protein [Cyclonatronaceae bacterium]
MPENRLATLAQTVSARFTDRGSRFHAHAFPVVDLQDTEKHRSAIAEQYPDATHHCFAWRYDPFQPKEFSQDDGEPSGTAGLPILGVIRAESLVNVLIIVVRYFGGTKLGKPGLIQAYRQAASLAVANAKTIHLDRFTPFEIHYPYNQENRIRELISRFRMEPSQEQYLESIKMTLYCRSDHAGEVAGILQHLAHHGITSRIQPECYRPVEHE